MRKRWHYSYNTSLCVFVSSAFLPKRHLSAGSHPKNLEEAKMPKLWAELEGNHKWNRNHLLLLRSIQEDDAALSTSLLLNDWSGWGRRTLCKKGKHTTHTGLSLCTWCTIWKMCNGLEKCALYRSSSSEKQSEPHTSSAHKLNLLCTWWKLFPHFCRMRKLLLLIIFPLNFQASFSPAAELRQNSQSLDDKEVLLSSIG